MNDTGRTASRLTTEEWRTRLQQLACEAGENEDHNLEMGFIMLQRSTYLPPQIRKGLANVAWLHLGLFDSMMRKPKKKP